MSDGDIYIYIYEYIYEIEITVTCCLFTRDCIPVAKQAEAFQYEL